jgi:hypothetical protein
VFVTDSIVRVAQLSQLSPRKAEVSLGDAEPVEGVGQLVVDGRSRRGEGIFSQKLRTEPQEVSVEVRSGNESGNAGVSSPACRPHLPTLNNLLNIRRHMSDDLKQKIHAFDRDIEQKLILTAFLIDS